MVQRPEPAGALGADEADHKHGDHRHADGEDTPEGHLAAQEPAIKHGIRLERHRELPLIAGSVGLR